MWWMVDTSAMIFLGSILFARIGWRDGEGDGEQWDFFISFVIATATNALFLTFLLLCSRPLHYMIIMRIQHRGVTLPEIVALNVGHR